MIWKRTPISKRIRHAIIETVADRRTVEVCSGIVVVMSALNAWGSWPNPYFELAWGFIAGVHLSLMLYSRMIRKWFYEGREYNKRMARDAAIRMQGTFMGVKMFAESMGIRQVSQEEFERVQGVEKPDPAKMN